MKRRFWHRDNLDSYAHIDEEEEQARPTTESDSFAEANLIGSLLENGKHAPCIDIDLPCYVIPTSTAGHFHLYFDREIEWEKYLDMLDAMVAARLVQPGFVKAARLRGQTLCRPPWVKKDRKPKHEGIF